MGYSVDDGNSATPKWGNHTHNRTWTQPSWDSPQDVRPRDVALFARLCHRRSARACAATITLAVILAYVSGLSLAILPIMKHERLSFTRALRVVWIGEGISIGIMELVMNWVDYWIGGVQAMSVLEPIFWLGLLVAVPAAFVAAWPANHWLLKKELRAPH